MRAMTIVYVASIIVGIVSGACLILQGGFGGGHGDWDRVLYVLSFPWILIPWPDVVQMSDFVRFTLLPFVFNLLSITLVRGAMNRFRPSPSEVDA